MRAISKVSFKGTSRDNAEEKQFMKKLSRKAIRK